MSELSDPLVRAAKGAEKEARTAESVELRGTPFAAAGKFYDAGMKAAVAAVLRELAAAISEEFDALNDAGYPEDFEPPSAQDLRIIASEVTG